MKTDLGPYFKTAQIGACDWNPDKVQNALRLLAADRFEIDWEPPNEEWERVLYGPGVLGLVCARIPLGIVRAGISDDRLSKDVTWIHTESLNARVYRIDPLILEEVFRSTISPLDYDDLSLQDLWYATVT